MKNGIITVLIMCLTLACFGIYELINSKEVEKSAAVVTESSTHYDTSTLETWCGEPHGNIRMIAGWYAQPNTIETEDGNWWSLNTESINPDECLLIWFDDMGTPEVVDDQIIKVWSEVYD